MRGDTPVNWGIRLALFRHQQNGGRCQPIIIKYGVFGSLREPNTPYANPFCGAQRARFTRHGKCDENALITLNRCLLIFYVLEIHPVVFIGLATHTDQVLAHLHSRLCYLGQFIMFETVFVNGVIHLGVHQRISAAAMVFR